MKRGAIVYFYDMKHFLRGLVFILAAFITIQLNASHIVGGYLSYRCLGPINATQVDYEITMFFYRDCDNGNPGTEPTTIPITIYSGTTLVSQFSMTNRVRVDTIPDDISNPCVASSPNVCVQEFVFVSNVTLARNQPHQLVYQRCCKNFIIDNLADPPPVTTPIQPTTNSDFYGNTFAIDIPAFDVDSCNTTPDFNAFPPILLCSGFDVNLDLSATDPDGDSLAYSLCAPLDFNRNELPVRRNFNGNLFANPAPDTANVPPYSLIPFRSPQTAMNPIPSSPLISINRQTGRLTGIATNLGTYTIGYCVEEFRNGVLINIFSREIQVQTLNCNPVVASAIQDQNQFCEGLSVQFINNSTANVNIRDYKWDFGIPGTMDDTSRGFEPIFTFPSTGFYTITLIANPDYPACSDTSTNTFEVRDSLDADIDIGGTLCSVGSSVDFSAAGSFRSDATFQWDFGPQASISTSTNQNVSGVQYPAGIMSYPVELIVSQDNCMDTVTDVFSLTGNPMVDFTLSDSAGCYPFSVTFTSSLSPSATADYEWDFGDGNMSTLPNPTHTYMANGYYNVTLTVRTTSGCIDTLVITKDSAVHVSLDSSMNNLAFSFDPNGGCAPLDVQFTNQSTFEGNATFTWTFGDGTFSSDQSPAHTYTENGVYSVSVSMITTDKCVDTLFLLRERIINVTLDSSTNMVDFDYFPKEGCTPLTVQFSDSSVYDGTARYFWDFGDGTLDTVQNPTKTYVDTGTYSVGLLLLPQGKCKDTLTLAAPNPIRVLPRPIAQINASDTLLPLKQALIKFDQIGSQFAVDHRYLVDGLEVMDDVIEYKFTDTGSFVVSYIATNGVGCEDTSSIEVFVFDEFEFIVPNVITPNNDGINDEFVMRACGVYGYDIQIYNRFGEKVFESNSLNINWDGRNTGRASNSGVYYYTIRIKDFKGEYLNYNGAVTVIDD